MKYRISEQVFSHNLSKLISSNCVTMRIQMTPNDLCLLAYYVRIRKLCLKNVLISRSECEATAKGAQRASVTRAFS